MSRKNPSTNVSPTCTEPGVSILPAQVLHRIQGNELVSVPVEPDIFKKADFVVEMFELRDIHLAMLRTVNAILRDIRTIEKSYEGAFLTNLNQKSARFVVVYGIEEQQEHIWYEIPIPHLRKRLAPERIRSDL